jgi:hypothetical protein
MVPKLVSIRVFGWTLPGPPRPQPGTAAVELAVQHIVRGEFLRNKGRGISVTVH